jgi:hypothetical protein
MYRNVNAVSYFTHVVRFVWVTFWHILSYKNYGPHGGGGAWPFTHAPALVQFVVRGYLEASCFWFRLADVVTSHSARQCTLVEVYLLIYFFARSFNASKQKVVFF